MSLVRMTSTGVAGLVGLTAGTPAFAHHPGDDALPRLTSILQHLSEPDHLALLAGVVAVIIWGVWRLKQMRLRTVTSQVQRGQS
jgi:hydrogenase/urease accessory protein HupE